MASLSRYHSGMSLIATARPSRIAWLVGYIVLCGGLGVWGGYDYWVRIPNEEREFAEFNEIKNAKEALEAKAQSGSTPLSPNEIAEYERRKAQFLAYADGAPAPVPAYDPLLQLWVYFVGCGLIGAPWTAWLLLRLRKRRAELNDAGDLTVDGTTLERRSIVGIDMSRWMSKSIATIEGASGKRLAVDDYLLKDAHLIIGRIAHEFHPEQWNEDATKVRPPEEAAPAGEEPSSETKVSS